MNWHGETFYSRNKTVQLKEANDLKEFVSGQGKHWVLVEQARLQGMKSTIGSAYDVRIIDKNNNKFVLTVVSKAGTDG